VSPENVRAPARDHAHVGGVEAEAGAAHDPEDEAAADVLDLDLPPEPRMETP